jgi:hypothetical protein
MSIWTVKRGAYWKPPSHGRHPVDYGCSGPNRFAAGTSRLAIRSVRVAITRFGAIDVFFPSRRHA